MKKHACLIDFGFTNPMLEIDRKLRQTLYRFVDEDNRMTDNNKPVKRFKSGLVEASIWKNSGTSKEGKEYETLSVSLQRSYQDKDGNWKTSQSYNPQDLARLHAVLSKATEYVLNIKEE